MKKQSSLHSLNLKKSIRIISCLTDSKTEQLSTEDKLIICADDLAPSETICFDKNKVLAFVTAYGSSNSHTAIIARSMNIPAIIGVGKEFLDEISDGQLAVADGFSGELIIEPDSETVTLYEKKLKDENEKKVQLENLKGKENITLDGTRVDIFANIGSVKNVDEALENDAGGIGLFRSELWEQTTLSSTLLLVTDRILTLIVSAIHITKRY